MSLFARAAALSPFGPIFGKELRVTARRKRSYVLRVVYLALLLLALLMAFSATRRFRGGGAAQQAEYQAELGITFFQFFSGFCIFAMGLIAPVLTATAVGSERLAKTLPVLLMTPISTWQIISGKLFSRMLTALTLLGLSLPVLALVRLLGGVELEQMLAVLCLCTAFALSSAAIGLLLSCLMNRAYAVILLSYAAMLFLYAFVPFVVAMSVHETPGLMEFAFATHPIFAAIAVAVPHMWAGRGGLALHWEVCCIVQLGVAGLLVLFSTLSLRRAARRVGEQPSEVNPESYIPIAAVAAPASSVESGDPIEAVAAGASGIIPYQSAQVARARHSPGEKRRARDVSDYPILWREVRKPLMARRWQRIVAAIACVGALGVTYIAIASGDRLDRPDNQIGYAGVFNCLVWLLVSVLSATAIATEKESDTWTLLLATPVTGKAVVWGKVAGLLRRMLWPMVLIAGHFLIFVLFGVVHPLTIVLSLWVIVTFNTIWIATGLYLSLRMRKVTFAVITNLLLAVLLYAVSAVVLFVFAHLVNINDDIVEHVLWILPYMYLGTGIEGLNRHWGSLGEYYTGSYDHFWLPGVHNDVSAEWFFFVVFAIGCAYLLVSYLILARTAAAFDGIVARAGDQAYVGAFETDEAVIPVGSTGYAGFWRRLGALAVDETILRGGCVVLGLLAGLGVLIAGGGEDESRGHAEWDLLARYAWGGLLASLVVGWLYYAGFEASRRRATPGKALMRVFVTDAEGRRPSFLRATGRYFAKMLSGALLGIGYLIAAFSPKKQALHDSLAGTLVLKR